MPVLHSLQVSAVVEETLLATIHEFEINNSIRPNVLFVPVCVLPQVRDLLDLGPHDVPGTYEGCRLCFWGDERLLAAVIHVPNLLPSEKPCPCPTKPKRPTSS